LFLPNFSSELYRLKAVVLWRDVYFVVGGGLFQKAQDCMAREALSDRGLHLEGSQP
jgi:hypothetical protein